MSSISQDFINNIGYLYEEIQTKDYNFLNEESEYYDEELAEISEDIILSLGLSMFSEGYTAETFLKFLSSSDDEVILEKYLTTDINFLYEENIDRQFIEEQIELLEKYGLQFLGKAFNAAKGFARKGVEKAATAGVEKRVGKQLLSRKGIDISVPGSKTGRSGSSIDRTTAALEKLSKSKAKKSGIDVPTGKLNPKQSTDLIKKARIAQAVKGVKTAATGSLLAGLGVGTGYLGAKMAGSGSGESTLRSPAPKGSDVVPKDNFLKGSALAKLGGREGRIKNGEFRTMKWSPESKARYDAATKGTVKPTQSSASSAPASSTSTSTAPSKSSSVKTQTPKPKASEGPKDESPFKRWATEYPDLAAKVRPGQSGYEEISQIRVKPSPYEKQDQTPTQGPSTAQIDTKSIQADLEKENEKLKKKMEQDNKNKGTTTESYEPYDVVLEYLIQRGHADTLEEANYIMLEMDSESICSIVEEYENYLFAQEVSDWVNVLLDEGYDLSEYSWDEIVEYYVKEQK